MSDVVYIGIRSHIDPVGRGPGGASRQAAALRGEGVVVATGHLGELTIDFGTYGWFPSRLPSEDTDEMMSQRS